MSSTLAFAGGEVVVRANDSGDRVRLVIEWPDGGVAPPSHTIRAIDDHTIEVTFAGTASIVNDPSVRSVPEIADVRRVSDPGAPLRLWITQSGKLYQRDISVGRRVVLDFARDKAARKAAEKAPVVPSKKDVIPAKPGIQEDKKQGLDPGLPPTPDGLLRTGRRDDTVLKADTALKNDTALRADTVFKDDRATTDKPWVIDTSDPPVVTISSLNKLGVAAFVRNQSLFVVIDDPQFNGTPKLSGKGAAKLGDPKRINTADATILKWALPGPVSLIRGEGGDLIWRIVMGVDRTSKTPPVDLVREDSAEKSGVLWPVVDVPKLVKWDDPETGEALMIAPVHKSDDYIGSSHRFPEFDTALSPIGMVIVSKVDDLDVQKTKAGVFVGRPGGLSVTTSLQAKTYLPSAREMVMGPDVQKQNSGNDLSAPPDEKQSEHDVQAVVTPGQQMTAVPVVDATGTPQNILYQFAGWSMGGVPAMIKNESTLVSDLAGRKPDDRASGLMNLGKMYLANGRGAEAVGYFRLALDTAPGLIDSPEFLGVRGAAYALNGQYDLALQDLNNPGLDGFVDVPLWRAVTLGKLQDWAQSATVPGVDAMVAKSYPPSFGPDMMLTIAESLLRAGKPNEAQKILSSIPAILGDAKKALSDNPLNRLSIMSYADYLNGELARQQGKKDVAASIWKKMAKSKDDKFRPRARLALASMKIDDGELTPEKAIDQLESMRFAWRGDDFEMAVGARLGQTYLTGGDYIRGLSTLRDTVSLAPDTEMGKRIATDMADAFRSLFTVEKMKQVDPLDAITIFEKFGDLTPMGMDANGLRMNLVDRLLEVDLLDRAIVVLQDLVDHKLQGTERVDTALRLAAVHLMNKTPDLTLGVLNRAQGMMETLPEDEGTSDRVVRLGLLRARALSQSDRVDQALAVLTGLPQDHVDVLRTGADIAWQTARWADAAQAFEKLLALSPVTSAKPPTKDQAETIRNLAIAINLKGDRVELARLRQQYEVAMMQTDLAGEFDVITRERQVPTLADRDTLTKLVNEVDLFGKFLDTFKKSESAASTTPSKSVTSALNPPSGPAAVASDAAVPAADASVSGE